MAVVEPRLIIRQLSMTKTLIVKSALVLILTENCLKELVGIFCNTMFNA